MAESDYEVSYEAISAIEQEEIARTALRAQEEMHLRLKLSSPVDPTRDERLGSLTDEVKRLHVAYKKIKKAADAEQKAQNDSAKA